MKYYPYLRAKQYELKALRELCEEYSDVVSDQLIPIIEPVNKEDRALTIAVETFIQRGLKFALVVNPINGDFKHHTILFKLPNAEGLSLAQDSWIPAYVVTNNAQEVMSLVEKEDYGNVMLVFPKGIDMAIVVNVDVMLAIRKMSSGELAEKVGISATNLSILKTGKAKAVRFSTLDALCKALKCQPGDILEYREDSPE